MANILKEKYLRHLDIWTVTLKNIVSLLWKSLLGTRDLVDKGARWRVGDDKTIRIWEHRWLPTPHTYKVQTPILVLPAQATFSKLVKFLGEGQVWNAKIIKELFWEMKAKDILGIPLSNFGQEDNFSGA